MIASGLRARSKRSTIACSREIPPRARTERDTPDAVDAGAVARAREFAVRMVDALDEELATP